MCLNLAQWAQRHGGTMVLIESWQDFYDSPANSHAAQIANLGWDRSCPNIRTMVEGTLFEGPAAWEKIIAAFPELNGVQWLATRLGLTGALAKTVDQAAKVTRRWCRSCGGRR